MTPNRYRSAILILLAALMIAACAGPGRGYDAALLLGDVRAGAEDSRLKRSTETPRRDSVRYSVDERRGVADRYRSGDAHRGPLVLIHGFTDQGRRDPQLVAFAHSLARSGFDVLVPEVPGLRTMAVGTAEIDRIADAVREAGTEQRPTGIAAVSFAAGPAVLAAMEPDTVHRVDFIVSVGGYYDLVDAIRYATTGRDAGSDRDDPVAEPRREGKWILLMAQLHHLDDPNDRELLEQIARRRLDDEYAPVDDLRDQLGPDGEAMYALVTNRDPDRLEALLADLPDGARRELATLDLARRDLSALRARLILIHGSEDRVIPVSHSERLRDTLPQGQARLYRAGGLDHVEVSPGFFDSWQLWRAATAMLRLADQRQESSE